MRTRHARARRADPRGHEQLASILHASPPVPGVLHLFLQLALQQLLLLALSLGTWDCPNIELGLLKVATVFP